MSTENDSKIGAPEPMLGWLLAPIAILLALLADYGLDFGLVLDMNEMTPFAMIALGAILAMTPRYLREKKIITFPTASVSLAVLIVSLILSNVVASVADSNFVATIFLVTMFGGYLLDNSGRHEWNTVLVFSMVGLWTAVVSAANFADTQTNLLVIEGEEYVRNGAWQEAVGYVFFSTWSIFTVLGLLAAVLLRGVLTPATDVGWFGYIKSFDGKWNKATLPLQIALGVWALTHILTLYYFGTLGDLNILGISGLDNYHGYIGFWPAALTGVVALVCAWMAAEKWYTRTLFIGSMWLLYIVSSLYESSHWESDRLEGTWAVWIWFGITFFIGVLIYWFATHEQYGGWKNRESHEPSQAKVFWSNHWAGIMVFMAFITGLAIRIQWYLVPSMNSSGLESWDLTGGSDPWYMKRVVDYVIAENAHLIWDADRNYPVGGINPRPPLFSWSMAMAAMLLTNLGLSSDEAVWYSMLALPAIFGALIVFPMAGIAKDHFGKGAGVIAAWLIAFMPTHVQKSTWAMADHDSFVLLFLTAAFMFYLRAIKHGGDERLSRTTNAWPSGIYNALGVVMKEKRTASMNAIAAGVCFGIVALGWKGFVYGPAIIFLAYVVQVAMNMLRKKDSTTISTINLLLLGTIFVMIIPFYAHPQLDLVWNSTGLQPLLFIAVFTLAIAWITTGFRDKPWLLVLGSLFTGGFVFGLVLYLLQLADMSNAWEVLTTGSGYFTKNKIFGTIAEASAPSRGQLFASFGPIVFVIAIVMGFIALWDGVVKKNQPHLILGMWVLIASYMAWSAGRFLFNAAPAMAVMGAWGITGLWRASGAGEMAKKWRRMGIRTPGERITNARKAVWRTPQFSAIGLVLMLIFSQHASYGLDAAMPSSTVHESNMDETIYNIVPDILRWNDFGFSILDDSTYDDNSRWYLGSFGSGFNDRGWNLAYEWLANQDVYHVGVTSESACDDVSGNWDSSENMCLMKYSDKPAFVSWWDYGFQALETGDHPSVADNFQSGIPAAGNMLLSRNQDDLVSMFIWRLSEADMIYNVGSDDNRVHTKSFVQTIGKYLSDEQVAEFVKIQTNLESDDVIERLFEVTHTNGDVVLAQGYNIVDGIVDTNGPMIYKVYEDGEIIPCIPDEGQVDICVGDAYLNFANAESVFNNNVRSPADTKMEASHYIVGDYWYTSDLIEEFNSVSTGIHRTNSKIALITQLLTSSLDSDTLHTMFADLSNNAVYSVQDYEGAPGDLITRDHEIRYLAVDTKLYPRGGSYNSEYSGGNPTGIFAPVSILSGQDFSTFMDEVYMTSRGQFNDEMTREEFDEEMTKDILNQQAGQDFDPLQLVDVRVDHKPAFFDTMLARTYVGYGSPNLGFATTEQPGQHWGQSGTPNSILTNALPMPGAMMNHLVIANWYNAEDPNDGLGSSNTLVKVMKYYAGAEICGQVTMSDNGLPLSDVRILLERDAFSGEDETDLDSDTYWIPIGNTDTDENGNWCFIAPAGKIRASAYAGEFDDAVAKDSFQANEYSSGLGDLTVDVNEDRETNAITALLGKVSNMTWMGEITYNITGQQADRLASFDETFDIAVDSSGISGTVTWTGNESFEGQALDGIDFILKNIWSMTSNYTLSTSSGSFTTEDGDSRIIQGSGEVLFTNNGSFDTQGNPAIVRGFTGNFTRIVDDGRSYTASATFSGAGTIVATSVDYEHTIPSCEYSNESSSPELPRFNETVENETVTSTHVICLTEEADTYYFMGEINATGRMTAEGPVTVVKYLDGETFEGTGLFEGIGTANGTGLFIGEGTFSGDMVAPGSFYKTGILPGTYNMIAIMPNGKEVLLPDPVEVGLTPTNNLEMVLPGSIFADTLLTQSTDTGAPEPLPNQTIELLDLDIDEDVPIAEIITDEEGNFSYGPIAAGEYQWRVDVDGDGWYEMLMNFTVGQDSENISLAAFIPLKQDVTINLLAGDSGLDLSNRTLTFTNTESTDLLPIIETAVSDENGIVTVELFTGSWIVSDENDEEYVLWNEFDLESEDMEFDLTYSVSVWINATLYSVRAEGETLLDNGETLENLTNVYLDDPSNATIEPASNVKIEARSGSIVIDTISDFNGNYSMRLPENMVFHVTADRFSGSSTYAGGILVENAPDLESGNIYLLNTGNVEGTVYIRESLTNGSGAVWSNEIPGSQSIEIIATNDDGLEWRSQLDNSGMFTFNLNKGNWTYTVSNELMNVEPVVKNNSGYEMEPVDLIANPDNVSVTFRIFLDTTDGTWENGSAIMPAFDIVTMSGIGINATVTPDDYDLVTGEVTLELSVGQYTIELSPTLPTDENATDYYLQSDFIPNLNLGLGPSGEPLSVPIIPEYLVTGNVTTESGMALSNSTVWLRNEAGDDFHPLNTDENGSFAKYVPGGFWYVEVADFTADDSGETEIFRGVLDLNGAERDIVWQTQTAMPVTMQLQEMFTGVNVTATRITAVSNEGLGNVSLGPSDNFGNISEVLMPGDWTLHLNRTETLEQWILEEGVYLSDNLENGIWNVGVVEVNKHVLIGGKIFWDLNDDDLPSPGEGVENATVNVTAERGWEWTLQTDAGGVWSVFVPIRDDYDVQAEKPGFDSATYTNETSSTYAYVVNDTHESRDLELTAGLVSVSGNVTDSVPTAMRLEGATVTLYPASGIVRDPVVITNLVYENDILSWSDDIMPGNWIVYVEGTDTDDNGGGIAVGLLEASVQEGASLDLEMRKGGRLTLTSSWTDIENTVLTAGDVGEDVFVTISLGDEVEWDIAFDTNGELNIILPSCEGSQSCVDLESEFETIQHDLQLTMPYSSGIVVDIDQDTAIDKEMQFTKKVDSDLTVSIESVNSGATYSVDDLGDLTATETDSNGYEVIELTLNLIYNGTEIEDVFSTSGSLDLTQDSEFWSVEFKDKDGNWVDSINVTMGIGQNNSDENQVLTNQVDVRITLPLQNQSITYDDGHTVKMRFTAEGGLSEETVVVRVPQIYNISLEDAPESIGIADGGTVLVTLRVDNLGNGDDTVSVTSSIPQVCVDAGWDVTPKLSNLTIAANNDRSQSFTVFAPTNSTLDDCNVAFEATSEGDFEVQTASTEVVIAVADLTILTESIEPRNADAFANQDGIFRVPIENTGFLSTGDVIVYLEASQEGTDYPTQQTTIRIAAQDVEWAEFSYSDLPPGTAHLRVRLDVIDTPLDSTVEPVDFSRKFSNVADGEESPWITVVIFMLTILALYGGYKVARKGSSSRF